MRPPMGPGILIAAAFVGPGTVTTCILAGANYGFALIWVLIFAIFATIILQGMAVRLGLAGHMGLGTALLKSTQNPSLKWISAGLILGSLVIGNAAYEAGNITGGAMGLDALFTHPNTYVIRYLYPSLIGLIAGLVLFHGRYKILQSILVSLALIMSACFLISLVLARPDFSQMITGLKPSLPEGALLPIIALIGTTIVPYNLFLHSRAVQEHWKRGRADIPHALRDSAVSISLGGLVSILILATAATTLFGSAIEVSNGRDMALAIEPAAGPLARYFIGLGLFAAGLTSAITAPMATAYVVTEIFPQWGQKRHAFRSIALSILAVGLAISLIGIAPIQIILFAQMVNGLLLPIIALFLLIMMNRTALLGRAVNTLSANILGSLAVGVTFLLGLRLILRTFGLWP